jgi:predicted membrane channel-forming protein YqfA (hemolysin III family)
MALSWKARRRLSILILLLAVPAYVVVAVNVLALFDRPPFWVELAVYVILGLVWVLPLKGIFRGVGRPEPQEPNRPDAGGDDRK